MRMSASAYLITLSTLILKIPIAQGAPLGAACASTGVMAAYRALTHQVGVVGIDDRKPITLVAGKLGLSPAEVSQIRKSVGFVTCPGTRYKNGGTATGFLIGSNQKLMTVGHIFIDKEGRWREPLSDCYFQNQDVPPKRVKLDIAKDGKNLIPGSIGLKTDDMDFAFAKLRTPLPGAVPLAVETSLTHELAQNERLYVISASQVGQKTEDLSQPLAQKCTVNDTGYYRSTTIYTDCDLDFGGSGSLALTRDENNKLVIRAIMVSSIETSPEESYSQFGRSSKGIGFDAKVSQMISQFISK